MRIFAVEEHFTFPDLLSRIDLATLERNGWPAPGTATFKAIKSASAGGYGPGEDCCYGYGRYPYAGALCSRTGAEIVSDPDGIAIAREYNDSMARLISAEPERFAAFAHLPMRSRSAAADELERAVSVQDLSSEPTNGKGSK